MNWSKSVCTTNIQTYSHNSDTGFLQKDLSYLTSSWVVCCCFVLFCLNILALKREPDLKSKIQFQILSFSLLAILNKSHHFPEPWFSHPYNGDNTCSAYLRLILKTKWIAFLSLPHCVGVRILLASPSWPLSSPASWELWSLSSCSTWKIQKAWIHSRELTWLCLPSLPRYQLKKIHGKTRQPLFCPNHNC